MGNAAAQRAQLTATLRSLSDEQWAAETLCAGWDAGDLAAHLVVRERDLLAAPGIVLGGPFARLTQERQQARKAVGRARLLAQLESGPPRLITLGPLDDRQAVEDWIHHEDVRRGGAGLPGRRATPEMTGPLWGAVSSFARLTLAAGRVDGVVALTDGAREERYHVRPSSRFARRTHDPADAVVSGDVGELVLFVTGRPADVDISGDEAVVAALEDGRRRV